MGRDGIAVFHWAHNLGHSVQDSITAYLDQHGGLGIGIRAARARKGAYIEEGGRGEKGGTRWRINCRSESVSQAVSLFPVCDKTRMLSWSEVDAKMRMTAVLAIEYSRS